MMGASIPREAVMSISVHSMNNVERATASSAVYWYAIFGVALVALAMLPLLQGDPAAALGTSVGMLVP
jgi:hypothetical protein